MFRHRSFLARLVVHRIQLVLQSKVRSFLEVVEVFRRRSFLEEVVEVFRRLGFLEVAEVEVVVEVFRRLGFLEVVEVEVEVVVVRLHQLGLMEEEFVHSFCSPS